MQRETCDIRRRARWGYRNESDVCVFLVQDPRIMLTLVRAARQPVCRAVGLRVQKFVPHVLQTLPSLIEGCRWRGDKRLVVFMSNVMERVEGRRKKKPTTNLLSLGLCSMMTLYEYCDQLYHSIIFIYIY